MNAMSTLLLRLQGPLQSWGTTSRFDERDTQLEPSKSGVLGLVCAALGRDRSEPVDDLAALRMGVRVDQEGILLRDYHTATDIINAEGKKKKKKGQDHTVVSPRYYLSDAIFLVGLEGGRAVLAQIHAALRSPVWPLALGRKSFVPSLPIHMPDALLDAPLEQALKQWPLLGNNPAGTQRLVLEDRQEGAMRLDQPIAPFAERRFGPRFVKTITLSAGIPHVPEPVVA